MILAAGLGTRLGPLTANRPKALVEVHGKTLLEHVATRMRDAGVRRLVVNVHHFADQVEHFLRARDGFGMDARVSDERDALLDTGGALLKARPLFLPGAPVLLHNVDILSDVDLPALLHAHAEHHPRATLVVQPPSTDRLLRFDDHLTLTGWENRATAECKIVNARFHHSLSYTFSGIQVISPAYLLDMHHAGRFSIIDEHLAQARLHAIRAFPHAGYCIDAGTPDSIHSLETATPPEL
jgi:NDP-sugar pyrophosphorylase family protein